MTTKNNSFMKGALILTLAGFLVKILGAVYRLPLALMIKDEGMGLYQMAYPIYITLLAISTAGLPTAISKMVAEDMAVGKYKNSHRIFIISLLVLSVIGFVLTVLLMSTAERLASDVMGNAKAFYAILSIAPAIFFVSIMSCFRGYFQGLQDMIPSAISQVAEQIGRVAAVFVLASYFLPYGVEFAAAGAAFGPVVGSVAGLAVLLIIYFKRRGQILIRVAGDHGRELETPRHIIYRLFAFAVPITLGGLITPVMNLADATIVSRRLQFAGFSVTRATELYGQLTGMAAPLINLPPIVTMALSASLVPAIAEAVALKNHSLIGARAETGIRVSVILGLPASLGIFLLAEPISNLLYKNPEAGISLAALSFGVLFLAITQTTTGILQGIGKTLIPVQNMLVGAAGKIILNYTLTGIPSVNIKGAAYGSVVGYMLPAMLNLYAVATLTGISLDFASIFVRPALAAIIMGLSVVASYNRLLAFGPKISTLGAIALGTAVFPVLLIVLGGIRREDMELLPGGAKLIKFLNKFGVMRR